MVQDYDHLISQLKRLGWTKVGAGDWGESEISRSEIFGLLSNDRRLRVLIYLQQHPTSTHTLGEIVDVVTAWENNKAIEAISNKERNRVYASLRQVHLPTLHSKDVIEFDSRRNNVEQGDLFDVIVPYLEYDPTKRSRWDIGYALLAITGVALTALFWIIGVPMIPVDHSIVALVTLILIGSFAMVHIGSLVFETTSAAKQSDRLHQ